MRFTAHYILKGSCLPMLALVSVPVRRMLQSQFFRGIAVAAFNGFCIERTQRR
jgi:hypothetical protein